jgi:hypothetical protein
MEAPLSVSGMGSGTWAVTVAGTSWAKTTSAWNRLDLEMGGGAMEHRACPCSNEEFVMVSFQSVINEEQCTKGDERAT